MANVSKHLTNQALNAAISAIQKNPNSETEQAFLDQLKNAHFLVPTEGDIELNQPGSDGNSTLKEAAVIKLPMVADEQDNLWQIVFTDWPSLRAWQDAQKKPALILTFADITNIILREKNKSTGLLINPGSNNLPVRRQMLAFLDGRANPYVLDDETEVFIDEPKDSPTNLDKGLKSLLKKMRGVKK
jgi:hypothetical protein